MRRHELSDVQWKTIEPLLPKNHGRGRPWRDHRIVVNGILWKLHTGAAWRDIPDRYGAWQTTYDRYKHWVRAGTWTILMKQLQLRTDAKGNIDWDLFGIDTNILRGEVVAGGDEVGRRG